jgi:insulin receptor
MFSEHSRYAMVVFDNQNLQDIWDFKTHPNLTISQGNLFFHYNRRLCYNKIEELVHHVGLENVTDEKDIARDTNGDQVTCETFPIEVEMAKTTATFAVFRWTNFQTTDSREILSWVLNYREVYVLSPTTNNIIIRFV